MTSMRRSRLAKPFALILLALPATSCATTPTAAPSEWAACAAWRPIYWSAHDTTPTLAQIKEGNAAHEAFCRSGVKAGGGGKAG